MTSLVSEYRRLAAASLDLAQRAAALADKMRLLVIAEAWLDLADRVAKSGPTKSQTGGSIEYLKTAERTDVVTTFGGNVETATRGNSISHGPYARGTDGPACKQLRGCR